MLPSKMHKMQKLHKVRILLRGETIYNSICLLFSFSVSDTNRKLMEDILRRSSENHNEMSSRVTALLAGSALTTKAGVRIERRDTVEQVDYTAVGKYQKVEKSIGSSCILT